MLKEYTKSSPNDPDIRLSPKQKGEIETFMVLDSACEDPVTGEVMAVFTTF
jgi:hypothetical protein